MLYRFAGLELDADRLELHAGSDPVELQPKCLQLLLYLVRNCDRTVPKSELFEQVWPGTRTVESALTRAMTLLRAALHAHASAPVIETVRGTGYRISAPVAKIQVTPGPPHATGREPVFLGRERELEELLAPLAHPEGAGARLCVLNGEAGIGKTALARELTARARVRGVRVLWGRCSPNDEVYGPWREILRAELAEPDAIAELRRGGAANGALALGVPEARRWSAAIPAPPSLDPERARRAFFAAVIHLQMRLAEREPLWLVIDDAHWADRPSLRLARELLAAARRVPISVLITRREVEPGAGESLDAEIVQLARAAPRVSVLRLEGLAEPDLEQLIEQTAGRRLRSADVRAIHARAGGNPLFARELVRLHLAEPDARAGPGDWRTRVPAGVRELLRRRLSPLAGETREVLRAASVIGRAFALPTLASVAARPADEVLHALAPAERAQVIEACAAPEGDFRFTHELFRETLYEDLPAAERVRLHRRAAEALEERSDAADVASLAHHYGRAALACDFERALDYAARAAAEASARLAFESAAEQLEDALHILDRHAPGDSARRAELQIALGEAHFRSGDPARAEASWWQAVHTAQAIGAVELAAQAAIRLANELIGSSGRVPAARIETLERVLQDLPAERDDLRAQVLAALAVDLHWVGPDLARPRALSAEGVALARRHADPRAQLVALEHRYLTLCRGDDFEERRRITDESLALAQTTGDLARLFLARNHDVALRTAVGDLARALNGMRECEALARELGQPFFVHYLRAAETGFDLLAGRLEPAAERIERGLRERPHEAPRDADSAFMFLSAQLFQLRRLQGRLPELVPALREACAHYPEVRAFRACLALALLVAGRIEPARAELASALPVGADGATAVREDQVLPIQLALLGEVCAELGDAARVGALEEQLAPFGGRHLVLSTLVSAGPADRVRGALAASTGALDRARELFARALTLDAALDAAPWRVLTELAWARAEDRAGSAAEARAHRARALELARAHDLSALAAESARS